MPFALCSHQFHFELGPFWTSVPSRSGMSWITTRCHGTAGYILVQRATSSLRPRESLRVEIVSLCDCGPVRGENALHGGGWAAGVTVTTRLPMRENWAPATRTFCLPLRVKRAFSWSLILSGESCFTVLPVPKPMTSLPKSVLRGGAGLGPSVVVSWWALRAFHSGGGLNIDFF
jgi:hypothetical protein